MKKNKIISKAKILIIFKNNIKLIIGVVLGLTIIGATTYAATKYYTSNEVSYDDSKVSGTLGVSNVQDALDEVYDKAKKCGSYVKVNIINGTISPSSKISMGNSTTFNLTPTTDYGCDSNIDACDLGCTNGATANILDNSTTLTISSITQNTECEVRLVRIANFSYSSSNTTNDGAACCVSSMPTFSTTYGTFKTTGTSYEANKRPLNSYCSYYSGSAGQSCTVYSTMVYKTNSCVVGTTISGDVCGNVNNGQIVIASYAYNVTQYISNRTHSCGSGLWVVNVCPSW